MKINYKKIYSSEEFKKLLEEKEKGIMILTYELKNNNQYYKYYVHSSYHLTSKQNDSEEYGNFFTIDCLSLRKMMNDSGMLFYENKKIPKSFKQNIKKHSINVNNQKDFYHGYWAGIHIILRCLLLEETLTPKFEDIENGICLPYENR